MQEFLNRVIHGNCAEIMAYMPNEYIDLTVTSPPYDDLRNYKGYSFPFEDIANQLYRITKPGGIIVWVVGDATLKGSETGTSFKQALHFKEIGFNLHDTMIYKKNSPVPLKQNRYQPCFEYMFIFSKGKPKTFKPIMVDCVQAGNTNLTTHRKGDGDLKKATGYGKAVNKQKIKENIWGYNSNGRNGTKDAIAYNHPAIFPEQLAQDHILSWSNEWDTVLDPFCGSGTTLKMAYLNNRNFVGIDCSDEYVELSNKRLESCQK